MPTSPSGLVRSKLFAFLKATFNTSLATAAQSYPGLTPFTIDFTPPKSTSFFYGRVDIGDLESTGTYASNLLTCFSLRSTNQHQQKPATFDGTVSYGLDTWITYRASTNQQDFEAMPECLEAMYYSLFNARSNVWGPSVGYDGDISVDIGAVTPGGKAWRRLIAVTLTFEVTF